MVTYTKNICRRQIRIIINSFANLIFFWRLIFEKTARKFWNFEVKTPTKHPYCTLLFAIEIALQTLRRIIESRRTKLGETAGISTKLNTKASSNLILNSILRAALRDRVTPRAFKDTHPPPSAKLLPTCEGKDKREKKTKEKKMKEGRKFASFPARPSTITFLAVRESGAAKFH